MFSSTQEKKIVGVFFGLLKYNTTKPSSVTTALVSNQFQIRNFFQSNPITREMCFVCDPMNFIPRHVDRFAIDFFTTVMHAGGYGRAIVGSLLQLGPWSPPISTRSRTLSLPSENIRK